MQMNEIVGGAKKLVHVLQVYGCVQPHAYFNIIRTQMLRTFLKNKFQIECLHASLSF